MLIHVLTYKNMQFIFYEKIAGKIRYTQTHILLSLSSILYINDVSHAKCYPYM